MSKRVEEPVEQHSSRYPGDKETSFSHPAFGQIRLSRIHGGSTVLYGTDFVHHGYVEISILASSVQRSLSQDWFSAGREYISVALSEAQWARFVSSFGQGEGVPCTVQSIEGVSVPCFPLRDSGKQHKIEFDERLQRSINTLRGLARKLDEATSKLPKSAAAALRGHVATALQELESNLGFVSDSFGEHMETRTEQAKVEVSAYINSVVNRAGLAALGIADAPFEIEDSRDKRE